MAVRRMEVMIATAEPERRYAGWFDAVAQVRSRG
jgi:hypothetical protein